MKPKPLKKEFRCHDKEGNRFYYEERIKSAVEWLKERLEIRYGNDDCNRLIDEAFEDVIKKQGVKK